MFSPSSTELQIIMSSFLFLSLTHRTGESDSRLNWQLNKHLIAGGHLRLWFRPAHEWRLLWPSSSLILPSGMYSSFSPSGCVLVCVCGWVGAKVGRWETFWTVCVYVHVCVGWTPFPPSRFLFRSLNSSLRKLHSTCRPARACVRACV